MTDLMDVGQNDHTYENVIYKKQQGRLTLAADQLAFYPSRQDGEGDFSRTPRRPPTAIAWSAISKHQVSPATYPKPLVKLILTNDSANVTFQLADRHDLELIRTEITDRLQRAQSVVTKKRTLSELYQNKMTTSTTFDDLDPTVLAVTRSSLLAANPGLRKQHSHLVRDTQTLTEDDFWATHRALLEEEYAKLSGIQKAGTSSFFASHLPSSGRIVLGIEEMRQIFILYPAVHKAYEEKVPLELSDEQFWRKYLESEYFHRDRGRMGEAARNHADPATMEKQKINNNGGKKKGLSIEEQEARAAAVGTDDLFSRYDQKLREQKQQAADTTTNNAGEKSHRGWGRRLACGQFDLASTFETERGQILIPKDNFPANQADDGKGARVIQKYNRHWAMVLHPDDAIAGSDLQNVARKSVHDVLPGDEDAMARGGLDKEMRKLVAFASANEENADHAAGMGSHDDYQELTLSNVDAYYSGLRGKYKDSLTEPEEELVKRHFKFASDLARHVKSLVTFLEQDKVLPLSSFPAASTGRNLLSRLTARMAEDARTEEAGLEVVKRLSDEERNKLQFYFGRSSELLRHFYGLRKLADGFSANEEKLARIVTGLGNLYREMETLRNGLPQSENGNTMRKMFLPIMHQLDWAIKLHRQRTGSGGGGGFVTVEG